MSVEFHRESPGKFDSRTLTREILSRWTGRNQSIFDINGYINIEYDILVIQLSYIILYYNNIDIY